MTAQCDECRQIMPIRGLTAEAIKDRLLADGWAVRGNTLLCPKHNPAKQDFIPASINSKLKGEKRSR